MTLWTLIRHSLRFRARAHLGVVLGAAVGSAALIGALVVGDSVRETLRERALERLDGIELAVAPGDRFFRDALRLELANSVTSGWTTIGTSLSSNSNARSRRYTEASVTAVLNLPATAARQDGSTRANRVQLLSLGPGLDHFGRIPGLTNLAPDSVILNAALADQLKARPGDAVVLRVRKPSALSRDAPISPQSDSAVALRLKVHSIAPAEALGNFSLTANQTPPFNAFVRADTLQDAVGLQGRANMLLTGPLSGLPTSPSRPAWLQKLLTVWRDLWPKRQRLGSGPPAAEPVPAAEAQAAFAAALHSRWDLADAELELRLLPEQNAVELRSPRIFLDPPAVRAALASLDQKIRKKWNFPVLSDADINVTTTGAPLLTYLVNQLRAGERTTPYSMVTAAMPPFVPANLRDDEIVITQWLADDLQIGPGAELTLTYFLADEGARLVERTNQFRVRAVVPMELPYADRTLMPEFPGLAKAESTHDWDAGFPLVHKIREQDDKYWKEWRGTPKAFVTLAAGRKMWANRFGDTTAIRFPVPKLETPDHVREGNRVRWNADQLRAILDERILAILDPEEIGLRFEPVREQALAAAEQSQDFGGLFLGFSFFLIAAALILMALLFQFGLEQRTAEVGTLLALGFTPKRVRRLLLFEGMALALVGGILGAVGGLGYARAMLRGLTTVWRDAVGTSALEYHATPATLAVGLAASVIVGAITIAVVLRKQARRPARELLAEGAEDLKLEISNLKSRKRSRATWVALGAGLAALGAVAWAMGTGQTANAEVFFSAGSLLLISGLAATAGLLGALARSEAAGKLSVSALGLRGATRRRKRSLAVVGLLACGSFLIAAIGAFRLDANLDALQRSSGTGGFALIGESTLPIVKDLNTRDGRDAFGLDEKIMQGVSFVPFRVRDGDDASCLNLNRAQTPRLLGVKPELMPADAFTFAKIMAGAEAKTSHWSILSRQSVPDRVALEENEIAAIGDAASIQWALHRKVGDTLDFTDERGRPFKVRLVGALANSILQGSLLIDEAEFVQRFPGVSGYRMFLIDAPSNSVPQVAATLTRALQDVGLEVTPAPQRLAAFNAVQNTYLNTFQVLGGLGLLLGSAGLGVVVLRNVLERRGELALLQAVGFRRRTLQWLVLSEHGGLLGIGLGAGVGAALVAILPVLLAPGAEIHYRPLLATLAGVLASGMAWTWVATWVALRGRLIDALRSE